MHDARELGESGIVLPAERRILVNAAEPEPRRRDTIAYELGQWMCQCLRGRTQPAYCRADEVGVKPGTKALEWKANIFAANLVVPESDVHAANGNRHGVSDRAVGWRLYDLAVRKGAPA